MESSEINLPGYNFRDWDIKNKIADNKLLSLSEYLHIVQDAISFCGTRSVKKGFKENSKPYIYICIKYRFSPSLDVLNHALKTFDLYKNA